MNYKTFLCILLLSLAWRAEAVPADSDDANHKPKAKAHAKAAHPKAKTQAKDTDEAPSAKVETHVADDSPAVKEDGPPSKPATTSSGASEAPVKPTAEKTTPKKEASVSSVREDEIQGFDQYPPALQNLIRKAIDLTHRNLVYQYGSCDPDSGGMDCSGAMYYILHEVGLKEAPRQSDEMCRWVMHHTTLFRTEDAYRFSDPGFSAIKPGDLVFWTGTYDLKTPRTLPVSHVMIYVGKRAKDGKPILFGSSEGRRYEGERRNGVSMFDFAIPQKGDKAALFGYGRIPGLKMEEIKKAVPKE